jgi:hypothetical protein
LWLILLLLGSVNSSCRSNLSFPCLASASCQSSRNPFQGWFPDSNPVPKTTPGARSTCAAQMPRGIFSSSRKRHSHENAAKFQIRCLSQVQYSRPDIDPNRPHLFVQRPKIPVETWPLIWSRLNIDPPPGCMPLSSAAPGSRVMDIGVWSGTWICLLIHPVFLHITVR